MSLVAYDSSSDEEDSCTNGLNDKVISGTTEIEKEAEPNEKSKYTNLGCTQKTNQHINYEISIPNPVKSSITKSIFINLPAPKAISLTDDAVIEEDDEFLHKKINTNLIQTGRLPIKKDPVKITIPSLNDFADVDKELAEKAQYQKINLSNVKSKSSTLLNILPKPKSETFVKKLGEKTANESNTKVPTFIPDTVRNKRPSIITEDVDRHQTKKKKINDNDKRKARREQISDSDSDGNGDDDNGAKNNKNYFCLDSDHKLPEVSANEIYAMVAKKAAQISETTTKFLNDWPSKHTDETEVQNLCEDVDAPQLDQHAMKALIGSSAKRKSQNMEDIKITELSSQEILPNRDEWMRTALASSTGYQVTGVLVDEEPSSGTRRKHQITYLAHKAKANEAELQAMWAANRQNRRATQSKYGF